MRVETIEDLIAALKSNQKLNFNVDYSKIINSIDRTKLEDYVSNPMVAIFIARLRDIEREMSLRMSNSIEDFSENGDKNVCRDRALLAGAVKTIKSVSELLEVIYLYLKTPESSKITNALTYK
jgi:hypothetical protein